MRLRLSTPVTLVLVVQATLVFGQGKRQSMLASRVTFTLADNWEVQKREDEADMGRIQLLVAYPPADKTPESVNAVLTARLTSEFSTTRQFADAYLGSPREGQVIVNDIEDGANWRTVVWSARDRVQYVILDRFGLMNRVAVNFRLAFPLLEKGDNNLIAGFVNDFNSVCASLKIDGANTFEAKVHLADSSTLRRTSARESDPRSVGIKKEIEELKQAVTRAPHDAILLCHLGDAYAGVEMFPQAVEAYRNATQNDPRSADAWYGLGWTLGASGLPKDAIVALKRAIELKRDNAKFYYNLGVAYSDLERWQEAAEAFTTATRLNPKDVDSFFNLGMASEALRRPKDALDAYQKALVLNPNDPQANYRIAIVYHAQGQDGFATVHYVVLQKVDPELAKQLHDALFKK